MTLTVEDLDRAAHSDLWKGWGYLGERLRAQHESDPECRIDPEVVARADRFAIKLANTEGWGFAELLAWCDSKYGRWYADTVYAATTRGMAERLETAAKYVTVKGFDGLEDLPIDFYRTETATCDSPS